jgi:hypothetical protein
VHAVKIDRSFIRGLATEPTDAAIVGATVDLARRIGLEVTAEGVEDEAAWTAVAEAGCDYAQGFYLARPLPPAELAALLGLDSGKALRRGLLELHPPGLGQEPVADRDHDDGRGDGERSRPEPAEQVDEDTE